MKIIHIVSNINNESAGPSYTVPALAEGCMGAGAEVEIFTLKPFDRPNPPVHVKAFKSSRFPHSQMGRSPEMRNALIEASRSCNIFHSQGIWMYPNIYAVLTRRDNQCKSVISPRGMLSERALGFSRWKKKISWFLGQGKALKLADMMHATSVSEYNDIRRMGLRQPVVLLPNGIEVCHLPEFTARSKNRRRKLLFLSRIHPQKNIEDLIFAWNNVMHKFQEWDLIIAGPVENNPYAEKMMRLAASVGVDRVSFSGEVTGKEKTNLYRQSDLLVLPTLSENFGMVVAEALAMEVPVICSKGAPWEGLEKKSAGWWIDIGEKPLTDCLEQALRCSPEELQAKGRNGRKWMEEDFSWNKIGGDMLQAYQWILEPKRCSCPEYVIRD